jgi:hypothetical protein
MKITAGESKEFDLIPENELVNVRVSDILAHNFEWEGETIHKLKWEFVISEPGQWEGKTVFGETSTTFTAHPNCKAYNWAVAITGKQYDSGETMDTDDLIGMPCRVMIAHKKDKKVEDRKWMRVREVLPAKAGLGPQDAPF